MDAKNACCCLSMLTAGELTQPPGKEIDEGISPGCGCNGPLVEQIRADLQARVEVRGNLGQIKQLEKMMLKFHDVAAQLPLILDKVGADTSYPPKQETMTSIYGSSGPDLSQRSAAPHATASEQFETKEYDVQNQTQNICDLICTLGIAGCSTHTLTLEPEQAVTRRSNRCFNSVDRKPYAQLGSVDEKVCCCIHSVNGLAPGCCGDPVLVKEIAEEMQARKVGRGNIAQLRNQENTMIKALETESWHASSLKSFPKESGRDVVLSRWRAALHRGCPYGCVYAQKRHGVPPIAANTSRSVWAFGAKASSR